MKLFAPQHPLIKKYVHNIYIIEKSEKRINYAAFPTPNLAIGLFRDAEIAHEGDEVLIKHASAGNCKAIVVNLLFQPMKILYDGMPYEIALNLKPLGFPSFGHQPIINRQFFFFESWNTELPTLFDEVFGAKSDEDRMNLIETFLLSQFQPVENEAALFQAMYMLGENENHTMENISEMTGMHHKMLSRSFNKYIGCGPAHFRKIARFRNSINERLKNQAESNFTQISYNNNYSDQSHFIKEYQQLTGENPKNFFRHITIPENSDITWRFY